MRGSRSTRVSAKRGPADRGRMGGFLLLTTKSANAGGNDGEDRDASGYTATTGNDSRVLLSRSFCTAVLVRGSLLLFRGTSLLLSGAGLFRGSLLLLSDAGLLPSDSLSLVGDDTPNVWMEDDTAEGMEEGWFEDTPKGVDGRDVKSEDDDTGVGIDNGEVSAVVLCSKEAMEDSTAKASLS